MLFTMMGEAQVEEGERQPEKRTKNEGKIIYMKNENIVERIKGKEIHTQH